MLVPLDIAALSADALPAGYRSFTPLITNGLGAGPTLAWAAAHGLFECLQRDGNGLLLRPLDSHARARKAFAFGTPDDIRRVLPPGYWERVEPITRRAAEATEPRQVAAFRRWREMDGPALRDLVADPVFTVAAHREFDTLPTSAIETPEAKGTRRLVAAGLDPLIRWGDESETRRPVRLTAAAGERLGGVPLLDVAAGDARVEAFYSLYREPGAHEMLFHR